MNKKITELTDEHYEIWKVYLDDFLFDLCSSFKKRDLKKKGGLNLEWVRYYFLIRSVQASVPYSIAPHIIIV